MAVLKLSQISASGANFTTGDVLIGVQGGTTDVGFSLAQVFAAPRTITGTGHAGTAVFSILPDSGASFIQMNDNGTMIIDADTATGSNPLTLKYNGTTIGRFAATGTLFIDGGTVPRVNVNGGITILGPDALDLFERAGANIPAGVTNTARLFAQDNGAGKTQLMVQMPTGTAIQLAIEV